MSKASKSNAGSVTSGGGMIPAITAAILVVLAGAVFLAVWLSGSDESDAGAQGASLSAGGEELPGNQYVLGEEASSGPTLVEFLDFQCPACATLKPTIDQAREQYAGEVTFAVRVFPLDSHQNAVPAAAAAEAAAQQGEFEGMYDLLFDGQQTWSSQSDPMPTFRGYAEELGLDVEEFVSTANASSTLDQVDAGREAAEGLGVTGTPTLYLEGEEIAPQSVEDFNEALDAALDS